MDQISLEVLQRAERSEVKRVNAEVHLCIIGVTPNHNMMFTDNIIQRSFYRGDIVTLYVGFK